MSDETDVSAIENAPQAHPRFSCKDADPWWPRCPACPQGQGPRAAERLSAIRPAALPRAKRLRRREEYVAALAGRPAVLRRHFSVFVLANALSYSRVGVTVSKKNAPRAVDRNRIKRLVREAFRRNAEGFAGYDLVVLARRCPSRDSWSAVREEFAAILAQVMARLRQRSR